MDLEVRHMRAFVALADEMNYTRAAAGLHVSQPALTRTIQQLERILECELLTRTSRALSMTEAGRTFADHARRIVADIDAVGDEMRMSATIRVGFAWLLPEWFGEITAGVEARGGRISLHRTDDPIRALARGEVDVAITRRPPADHSGVDASIRYRAAGSEHRLLAVATASEVATRADLHWDDLASEPLIINVLSGTTTEDSWTHSDPDRVIVRCNNFDEWIELTAAGRGISAVPDVVRDRAQHPAVTYRDIPGIPDSTVHVAWRERTPPLRSIEIFLDVVG
ncbi:LysR family transcriptional regulator [Williamsia sp.]|uniref:LysR family transcriptional regulator n=1 Tax=Williamsia sp. TaxID=1872085 RepID=UPI001A1B4922|nr:LysR family transcriptional regulator [Williamsia sp.]MBJ7287771.1 LysR family transcriptional regulator [Williamsia sp.]